MPDPLDAILLAAGVDGVRLRRDAVEKVARTVSGLDPAEFIEAVVAAPGLSNTGGADKPLDYFEIHGRDWWLDVAVPANRDFAAYVVVAAALTDALRLPFRVSWVSKVVRYAVLLKSVDRTQSGLVIRLRRQAGALPPELASIVHPEDFSEFLQAVAAAPATLGPLRFE